VEASEALGGGTGEQTAAGAEGAQTGQQQGTEIPQVIADRFGELDRTFGERFDQLQEALQTQAGPQYEQPGGGGEDVLFYDEQSGQIVDAQGRPVNPAEVSQDQGIDPRVLQGIQQQMQQTVQQQMAPMMEYFQDQQAAALEDEFPDFRDEKYAQKMVDLAEEHAESFDMPELARNVGFIRLLHLAEVGKARAAGQETPAGASEQGVALETDGVSNAGGSNVDPGDRIVQAAGQRNGFFNS
jgi:hypothetical protein